MTNNPYTLGPLEGPWEGFEQHLADAVEELLAQAEKPPAPVPETYEQHLVLENF